MCFPMASARRHSLTVIFSMFLSLPFVGDVQARAVDIVEVEGQPLAENVKRLRQAYDYLGAPLPAEAQAGVLAAAKGRDARKLQQAIDPFVHFVVYIDSE